MISKTVLIWSAVALLFGVVAYSILTSTSSQSQNSSKKAEQVKLLREEYKRREFGTSVAKSNGVQVNFVQSFFLEQFTNILLVNINLAR